MTSLEPFRDQTEVCINSPQLNIPDESVYSSNVSKLS